MYKIEELLKNFKPIGKLVKLKGQLAFEITNTDFYSEAGFVYLWVAEKNNNSDKKIIYVGMTKFNILERLKQHENGFKYSNSGKKNAKMIDTIPDDYSVMIYCRLSKKEKFFNSEEEISLCAAEEQFFITIFRKEKQPLINGVINITKYKF